MNDGQNLRAAVRTALALAPRRRRHSRLPGAALCGALLATPFAILFESAATAAQPAYRQELLPGFSSFDVGGYSGPEFADLDGDGDLDGVVGELGGRLFYFANTGSSLAPSFIERPGAGNPFGSASVGLQSLPSLADLDGDGDLDAVVGKTAGSFSYFENTGSASAPAFVLRTGGADPFDGIDVGGNSAPDLVDLDGDGDLDLTTGSYAGNMFFYRNTGGTAAPVFALQTGSADPFASMVMAGSSPVMADLDADGDLDAMVGNLHGSTRYFRNTGNASQAAFVDLDTANPFLTFYTEAYNRSELADLDGDGDLDALTGDVAGSLRYFRNGGSPAAPAFAEVKGTGNPWSGFNNGLYNNPELVDLDADGDLDAVVGGFSEVPRYFRNTGGATAPAFLELTGIANPTGFIAMNRCQPDLIDLDADGDFDIAFGQGGSKLFYGKNTGNASNPSFEGFVDGTGNPFLGIEVAYYSSPALADLDGDGDLDLVVGQRDVSVINGSLSYFENTGNPAVPVWVERIEASNPFAVVAAGTRSKPELVDFDGDGDVDLVSGRALGDLIFAKNAGPASAPAYLQLTGADNPFAGLNVGGDSSPTLADLDGDGDLDALVGEHNGRMVFFRSLAAVFADGFETGETDRWSSTVPEP